jgi:hypothetical protein
LTGGSLKFDGFTACIERPLKNAKRSDLAVTVEAWIALASYPWAWSPIADCSQDELTGFFFGINNEGHLGFKIAAGNTWLEIETESALPLARWTHVSAVFVPGKEMSIYINGQVVVSEKVKGNYIPTLYGKLTIGRNAQPKTWIEGNSLPKTPGFFSMLFWMRLKFMTGQKVRMKSAKNLLLFPICRPRHSPTEPYSQPDRRDQAASAPFIPSWIITGNGMISGELARYPTYLCGSMNRPCS